MTMRRIFLAIGLSILLSTLIAGFPVVLGIPPSVPVTPPAEPPLEVSCEIAVYFGESIPDEEFDAIIGDEWSDASSISLMLDRYIATAYVKHDGEYVYIAFKIETGTEYRHYSEGYIWFNNGDDIAFSKGDDIITVEGEMGDLYEADFYYVETYHFEFDPAVDCTNDAWGIGAYDEDDACYVFEFLRVLDSGDSCDVSLPSGSKTDVVFGFVGEASPQGEFVSTWHILEIISEAATQAARQVAKQMVNEVRQNLLKDGLLSEAPSPSSIKLDNQSFFNATANVIHIKPGSPKAVVGHEYGHLLLRYLLGETAYNASFGNPDEHEMLREFPGAKSRSGSFEEGFATVIAAIANRNYIWNDGNQRVDLEYGFVDYKDGTTEVAVISDISGKKVRYTYGKSKPDGTSELVNGNQLECGKVELCVACALWDILDGAANKLDDMDEDGLSVPLKLVLKVIKENRPKNFEEFVKALKDELSGPEQAALDKILTSWGHK